MNLLRNNSEATLLVNNKIKVMADGVLTFALMFEAIEKAKTVINVQFLLLKTMT